MKRKSPSDVRRFIRRAEERTLRYAAEATATKMLQGFYEDGRTHLEYSTDPYYIHPLDNATPLREGSEVIPLTDGDRVLEVLYNYCRRP